MPDMSALTPIENKSLHVAVENKSADAGPALVAVRLAHAVPAGRIGNDKTHEVGDVIKVNEQTARQLVEQGVGVPA